MKNLAIVPGSKLLKAMGNARRLEILYYLMQNEMNVTELEKAVGLEPVGPVASIWPFCGRRTWSKPGGRRRRFIIRLKAKRR